jgi:hypothetical protein
MKTSLYSLASSLSIFVQLAQCQNPEAVYDRQRIEEIITALRRLLSGPHVVEIKEHFAGYFDELGITVELTLESTHGDMLALKEKAASYLLPGVPHRKEPFKWMLKFRRAGEEEGVLFPDGMFVVEKRRR